MKAKEIIKLMNNWAPAELIDNWDNTGFQIGNDEKDIKRILISLDLDERVYNRALDGDFHMIITHHPIIFKPITSITTSTYKEKLLFNLIQKDIVVYNAHTNLDRANNGVNDELAKLLGLRDPQTLEMGEDEDYGYGRVGDIEEQSLKDYLTFIKKRLDTEFLIVYGDMDRTVKRVALCGGSGSGFIYDAYKKEACIYITGDIKYHDAQYGTELGLTIVDAGHYHTEKIILPIVKEYLEKNIEDVYIEIWKEPSPPYGIF
ncbi:MAG: Nif3-like dinuclear metal center hexameric protein [Tissierellia bacterium]|nr:Nif3-like dinuclear metal center hexameric protein [Tissierellia bacterium]